MTNTKSHSRTKSTSTCADFRLSPTKITKSDFKNMSLEEIYDLLETRHGGAFAQWYIDQLTRKKA